jgi:hypothetical protein
MYLGPESTLDRGRRYPWFSFEGDLAAISNEVTAKAQDRKNNPEKANGHITDRQALDALIARALTSGANDPKKLQWQ